MEPLVKVLLEDIATEASNMSTEVRALWDTASESITELHYISERIFDILRQQSQHNETILNLVDEINITLEHEQARLQIFSRYRDWVGDLRDYLIPALNSDLRTNYGDWGAISRDIRREQKLRKEAVRRGKTYDCVVSEALNRLLASHNLTMEDLEGVLQMKSDSNTMFHRPHDETSEAAIQALDEITFPPKMRHLKDALRKTIEAVAALEQRELENEFGVDG
ncbi:hypothetical protein HDU85_001019 [Gaertneriomyces sp. JEL0708]|nr:hypothetical protein HDU85_001019 [Gaertneriomyces sp. JEL0708]